MWTLFSQSPASPNYQEQDLPTHLKPDLRCSSVTVVLFALNRLPNILEEENEEDPE